MFLASVFKSLPFSSYENNIAKTAFRADVLIIFIYFKKIKFHEQILNS